MRVYSRGDFKSFSEHRMASLGLECLVRHMDAERVNPRVVIAPRVLVAESPRVFQFEGALLPDLRRLHEGALDWVLLPVHHFANTAHDGHALLFVLCAQNTGSETVSIRLDVLDPNGARGSDVAVYERIVLPTLWLFNGVALHVRVLLLPNVNDLYDDELHRLDTRHRLTRLTTHANGFCAVWVFAFVLDLCCSRSRDVTRGHIERLRDRAAGDAALSQRKRRYNTLIYLRAVLTHVVDIMRADPAAAKNSVFLASFTTPVSFHKLRPTSRSGIGRLRRSLHRR